MSLMNASKETDRLRGGFHKYKFCEGINAPALIVVEAHGSINSNDKPVVI